MSVESLWGDFEELEETQETPKEEEIETETPKEGVEEETPKEGEEQIDEPKKGEKEEKEVTKSEEEEDELSKTFNDIASYLEDEELMFLEEDKTFDSTPEGFKKMLEENFISYKNKLEEEFKTKELTIRNEYEKSKAPKISEMDPSDEYDAIDMLQKYYLETGFTEDEAADKLKQVKELGDLEKEAKIAQRYLGKQELKKEELELKQREEEERYKQKQIEDYISAVKSEIDETEEMSGFKLTNKMKKDFKDYMFKFDKDGMTEAQKASKDPKRRLKLAFLDFVDYNKKDFEIKAKTELANEYTKKNSRFTSKQAKTKGANIRKEDDQPDEGLKPGFLDFWSTPAN